MKGIKNILIITVLGVLFAISCLISCVSAIETGGYVVEPAYGISPDYTDIYFGSMDGDDNLLSGPQPEQTGYSDLPLPVLIILAFLGAGAVLAYPAKLLLSGKLPALTGLSRLKKSEILENGPRRQVYETIVNSPGVHLSEIEKNTGLTNKNVEYHVKKLLSYNMVVSKKTARGKGYFRNSGTYSSGEKLLYLHSKNPTERKILETINENPGISRKELSIAVKISAPSVSWYISGLVRDNIITKEQNGGCVSYCINDSLKKDLAKIVSGYAVAA
ncbi:putative transcriptional regulator [Methanomicrobium sp. W14]|uniref:winged helix-turn-helix transcriptional regulator n=1 Tax=Methanomicrobium sp. W14 TaxID=2817839 RepID=UPI001AEB8656|nr:winged helix-turn-helix transcriptional regulator [Methanomicrobium sp. W14]MBP2134199.1 putative transcriptional regulator [Methanomicrobium sp. W14]